MFAQFVGGIHLECFDRGQLPQDHKDYLVYRSHPDTNDTKAQRLSYCKQGLRALEDYLMDHPVVRHLEWR